MKHLGDITKIDGHNVPFVDCIIGGSPCQDLSIAGKRAGLAGARSGLFMEQIRVIKEMREQSGAVYPRFMVWENVPGAFSSNGGKDFAAVLEETIKVCEPKAPPVQVPDGGWPKWGSYRDMDGRWSVAWRTLDAQYWGVPQRRSRIALVADFRGCSAAEILFERKSMYGNFEPCEETWKETPGTVGNGIADASNVRGVNQVYCLQGNGIDRAAVAYGFSGKANSTAQGIGYAEEKSPTLSAARQDAAVIVESPGRNGKYRISEDSISGTLCSAMGAGGGNTPLVMAKPICIGNGQAHIASHITEDVAQTLNCMHDAMAIMLPGNQSHNTVRRITPLECERLQGYPDGWTDIGEWFDTNGKRHKESSDTARYKALGNSIALPPWRFVLYRLCMQLGKIGTMASLFDGIGGFPLIWEQINGKGSCLWASEIEEFPIAVTKYHFGEN